MIHCLNPDCPAPKNPESHRFCQSCGWRLQLGDRFEAVYSLGQGRNSHTLVGRDRATLVNAQCLIKQFTPNGETVLARANSAERFRQEVERLAIASQHPQIPDLYAYFEQGDAQFLVQQFLVGPHLDQHLQAKMGPWDSDEVAAFLRNVLPVLQHLHHNRLIHRDIKPTNFRQPPGQSDWWLVDFGAIKPVTATQLARPGTLIGSADYASPEQLRGEATYASDLYSLGVVCLHLLTGLQPFDLFDSVNGCWQWRSIVPDVSPRLATLIDGLVQPTRRDRFPDVPTAMASLGMALPSSPAVPALTAPSAHTWQPEQTVDLGTSGDDLVLMPATQQLLVLTADGSLAVRSLSGSAASGPPLQPHPANITAIAAHPQRAVFVTGDRQGQLQHWAPQGDLWQPTVLATVKAAIAALQFSASGDHLWVADERGQIQLWDGQTRAWRPSRCDHPAKVTCLALSRAGHRLASGDTQGSVKLWESHTLMGLRTLSRQPGGMTAIAWLPGDDLLVTAGWDVTLQWRCPHTGGIFKIASAEGFYLPVRSLLAHPTEPWVVSGSQDGQLQRWASPRPVSSGGREGGAIGPPVALGEPIVALRQLPEPAHFLGLTATGQLARWSWCG